MSIESLYKNTRDNKIQLKQYQINPTVFALSFSIFLSLFHVSYFSYNFLFQKPCKENEYYNPKTRNCAEFIGGGRVVLVDEVSVFLLNAIAIMQANNIYLKVFHLLSLSLSLSLRISLFTLLYNTTAIAPFPICIEQTMCEQFATSETISGQRSTLLCLRTGIRNIGQLPRCHGKFRT